MKVNHKIRRSSSVRQIDATQEVSRSMDAMDVSTFIESKHKESGSSQVPNPAWWIPQHVRPWLNVEQKNIFFGELKLDDKILARAKDVPLRLIYPELASNQILRMKRLFEQEIGTRDINYLYAFAMKTNTRLHLVTRLVHNDALEVGSEHEVDLASELLDFDDKVKVLINGVKITFLEKCLDLALKWQERVIVIFDSVEEFTEARKLTENEVTSLKIGLRLKVRSHPSSNQAVALDSRFGMTQKVILRIAQQMPKNFELVMLHANAAKFSDLEGLVSSYALETYRALSEVSPSLTFLNVGGGMNPYFSDEEVSNCLRITIHRISSVIQHTPLTIVSEFGKYTAFSHSCLIMRVVCVKQNSSALPWYIVNGSIMNTLPDTWALAEHFIVLPLTHLNSPKRRVRLAGLTCDEDDVYPPHGSNVKLYLPMITDNLYVGFFGVGAYEEMLSGFGGLQHCSIPHPTEVLFVGKSLESV